MAPGPRGHRGGGRPEETPLSGRCGRDGAAAAAADVMERPPRLRERLDAAAAALGELEKLRRRQEALVRAALEPQPRREPRSPGETLLELRRQLVGPTWSTVLTWTTPGPQVDRRSHLDRESYTAEKKHQKIKKRVKS